MSYSNYNCLTTFSASQVAIMYSNLNPAWSNSTTLNAPSTLCAGQTGNFYAPYSPASYQWVVPSGWTIVSGQGTRHAVIQAGNSSGTVHAYPSCGNPRLDKQVSVTPSVVTVSGPGTLCSNDNGYYTASYVPCATYTWSVNGMNLTSGQGTSAIYVSTSSNFSGAYVYVSISNGSCSGSGSKYVSQDYNCGYYLTQDSVAQDSVLMASQSLQKEEAMPSLEVAFAYPNPTHGQLSIKLEASDEYTVQLLQENGGQLFQGTFITDRIVLPMEQYPDGMYYIRITRGKKSVVKRIYIKN